MQEENIADDWQRDRHSIEILGVVLLFFGNIWGLTVASTYTVANCSITISRSWLLLLGTWERRK